MNWRFLRAFPKYAVVLGIFLVSTALFAFWWYFGRSRRPAEVSPQVAAKIEAIQKRAASLPDKLGWLALVGNDLYNVQTGELLFPNWLRGVPQRIFYHPESNRLLVQAEKGLIRFGLDGKQDGVMAADSAPAFTNDGKLAMWIKSGDISIADVDWTAFKFTNERQATHYGQFYAPYFNANVVLASQNACIVRIQNRPLRVDFRTGELKQMNLPLTSSAKGRSPDCEFFFGDDGERFVAYDVNKEEASFFPRDGRLYDVQWLDNDHCALLLAGKSISLYDRKKNSVTALAELPVPCDRIKAPSPDGRYVLAGTKTGLLLVDTKEKKVEDFGIATRHLAWVTNDTVLFQREVPDMQLRGTWLKTVGGVERQVMAEPYIVGQDGIASMALLEDSNFVVFSTKEALLKMRPDGTELQEIAKLKRPGGSIQGVRKWGR